MSLFKKAAWLLTILLKVSCSLADDYLCSPEPNNINETKISACEIQYKTDHCEDFKKILEDDGTDLGLLKKCPDSESASTAIICSPMLMSLGAKQIEKFGVSIVEKIPQNIMSRLVILPRFFIAATVPLTAYSIYQFTEEAFEKDKKCFENNAQKIENLNFLKETSNSIISNLEPYIDIAQKRNLQIPDSYFNQNFVENLSCQRLNEIILDKKKNQDQIIGPLLAKGILKIDPRKIQKLTTEEIESVKKISNYFSCVSRPRQIQFLCSVGNSIQSGKEIKNLLKKGQTTSISTRPVNETSVSHEQISTQIANSREAKLKFNFLCGNSSAGCDKEVLLNQNFLNHIKPHTGWDLAQKKYFEDMLSELSKANGHSEKNIEYWLNAYSKTNAKKGLVNPLDIPRPFRNNKVTSVFPENVTPDEVLETFKRKPASYVLQNNERDLETQIYRVQHGDNFYDMILCAKKVCTLKNPERSAVENEVVSLYPFCGPHIRAYISAKSAKKKILTQQPPYNESDFMIEQKCKN